MRRTFGFDALRCPTCDARMRVVSTLTDPDVVKKILAHLGMPTEPLLRGADQIAQRGGLERGSEFGEGGLGLTALGESSGGSGPCDAFHARLAALLRIRRPEEMVVRYGRMQEESGPAVKSVDAPWLWPRL